MNILVRRTRLTPFGLEITALRRGVTAATVLTADTLPDWIREHRVLVLRGFAALPGESLVDFCRVFGELQDFEFGKVNDIRVKKNSPNYLFTTAAVPFHWDGAFLGRVPSYIVFHCDRAPTGGGGDTLFCDTTRVLAAAPADRRWQWGATAVTYTTEKLVHYGGSFTSPVLGRHPHTGEQVLRFAEPVDDLNPVRLDVVGVAAADQFLTDLRERLYDPTVCLAHAWRKGDLVIADNHALLHGRQCFAEPESRKLRRVNIL